MSEDAQDVVLVVEDDPSILMVLSAYLSGEGYRVLRPKTANRLLKSWRANPTWT
jgi:two-component system cell cycle response regulator CpdR